MRSMQIFMGLTLAQIMEAAKEAGHRKNKTAELLGVSDSALVNNLKKITLHDLVFPEETQKRVCGVPYNQFVETVKRVQGREKIAEELGCSLSRVDDALYRQYPELRKYIKNNGRGKNKKPGKYGHYGKRWAKLMDEGWTSYKIGLEYGCDPKSVKSSVENYRRGG